jgi:hypothetical protein
MKWITSPFKNYVEEVSLTGARVNGSSCQQPRRVI